MIIKQSNSEIAKKDKFEGEIIMKNMNFINYSNMKIILY